MEKQWFVLHTLTGQETRFASPLTSVKYPLMRLNNVIVCSPIRLAG